MEKWRAKAGSGVETGPEGLELAAVMTIIIRDADSRKKWSRFSHWVWYVASHVQITASNEFRMDSCFCVCIGFWNPVFSRGDSPDRSVFVV